MFLLIDTFHEIDFKVTHFNGNSFTYESIPKNFKMEFS